jgi:hypothetical protein
MIIHFKLIPDPDREMLICAAVSMMDPKKRNKKSMVEKASVKRSRFLKNRMPIKNKNPVINV